MHCHSQPPYKILVKVEIAFTNYELTDVGVIIRDCVDGFLARFSVWIPFILDSKCENAHALNCVIKLDLESSFFFFGIYIKGDCI